MEQKEIKHYHSCDITSSSNDCDIIPNERCNSDVKVIDPSAVPDGGYGWIIVFAAFMLNMIIDGIRCSFGVLLDLISKDLQMNQSDVSCIGSVHFGMSLALAPLTCWLVRKFGCRAIGICGGVILGLGLLLTYLTMGFWHLFVWYGILAGSGQCCLYSAAMLAPNYYFEKKRAFAVAFTTCGAGGNIIS